MLEINRKTCEKRYFSEISSLTSKGKFNLCNAYNTIKAVILLKNAAFM